MGKVGFQSYSQIQPRKVDDASRSQGESSAVDQGYEKRQGAAGKLRSRLASLAEKLSGALGRKRVESSVMKISDTMNAASMKQAMQKISEQRIARYSTAKSAARAATVSVGDKSKAKGPSATSSMKKSDPAASSRSHKDKLALRDAITDGLFKAMKSDRGERMIDEEAVVRFRNSLSMALGLEDGELQHDQFGGLLFMKSEIEPFLPAEVRDQFDQLMLQAEKKLPNG